MSRDRCYLEINTKNFRTNLKNLQEFLGGCGIIGIVKANYYGHGAIELGSIMYEEGVRDFAVATLYEAIKLRKQGLQGSILILGYVEKHYWQLAKKYDCILSVADYREAQEMLDYVNETQEELEVEIKVDTGMHRLGVDPNLTDEQLISIYRNPYLKVVGTFSHLCVADQLDEESRAETYRQKGVYDHFLERLAYLGLDAGRTHLQASSGILNYPDFHYDYVRPGFMLLGFTVGEVNEAFTRLPVLSWHTKIQSLREINAGEGVSYGHTFKAGEHHKVATLSVGYADGYPRCLSNKGYVMIHGQKAPVIGNICMDQMMVDVTDIDCLVEDDVILIGKGITATELADLAGTIVDEIVCNLDERVSRNYI